MQVVGKHLLVEHVAGSCSHGGNNVFLVHTLGPFDNDVVDAGFFHHGEDQHAAFKAGLHIAEISHFPDALHFFVDGVGIGGITFADGQAHEHGIRVHNAHAANLHVGQAALGCRGRTHGHKAGAVISGLRGGGGSAGSRYFRSASGQGTGTVAEGHERVALKACGYGFALLHRHKARVHVEAVAKLVEAAVNDKLRSGLTAQGARCGKVNGFTAAALQLPRRIHRHNAHAALLELVGDDLGYVLGGIGHFRPGIYLKGQYQNKRPL